MILFLRKILGLYRKPTDIYVQLLLGKEDSLRQIQTIQIAKTELAPIYEARKQQIDFDINGFLLKLFYYRFGHILPHLKYVLAENRKYIALYSTDSYVEILKRVTLYEADIHAAALQKFHEELEQHQDYISSISNPIPKIFIHEVGQA